MFKNVHYDNRKSVMHVWEQIKEKDFYEEIQWVPYVFIEDEEGEFKSIEGTPVSKKTFKNYIKNWGSLFMCFRKKSEQLVC